MEANSEIGEEQRARIYPIVLSGYNHEWPKWYAEEKERLISLIGNENIVRISHIGSTSVPGLLSKPTVDILLEADESADIERMISNLPESEYICLRQQTIPTLDRVLFLKGYTDTGFAEKVFHIHVRNSGDWDELYFRDHLISHPDTAKEYEILKLRSWKDHKHDRDGYTKSKSEFILKYSAVAKQEFRDRYCPKLK
jgi:GrpB-like predicted nucleotidyltransferase (UPF0157 family)